MSLDTVVALSSGQGRSGVAVLRASGPGVRFGLETVAGAVPAARVATLRTLRDSDGSAIDRGLVLYFPGPASFTGEDLAEFHVHGGRAVVAALLTRLVALPGWRLAEPGAFSRRAVENGKFDLTTAEGVADLIDAETAAQRRQAVRSADGLLENAADGWRVSLVRAMALLEAEIDFPDEGDVPVLMGEVRAALGKVETSIAEALRAARAGERLREGVMVVLAGPPNAGKSTLLNALARREVALVSPIAGTTRDALEVQLDLMGYPVTLVDTAGLRETIEPVEAMGVARSRVRIREADIVLWLSPVDAPEMPPDATALLVHTKADLDAGLAGLPPDALVVSAETGAGLERLLDGLAAQVSRVLAGGEDALVTRARHRQELAATLGFVREALSMPDDSAAELMAEAVRLALRAIARLTGRVDIDEVYDVIFRQFCIGK